MNRLLLLTALLLAGCSTTSKPKTPVAAMVHYPLQPPASFGRTAEFEHLLQGDYQGRTFNLHAMLRMDPKQLLAVGLTPMGTRAFSLRYDGKTIKLENPSGPKMPFPPEMILSDIQEMFWPSLPDQDGWRVTTTDPAKGREFFFANEHISTVQFSLGKDGKRVIELSNLKYGYHLRLQVLDESEPK